MKFGAIIITGDYRRKTTLVAPDIDAALSDLQERHAPDVSAWNVSQAYGEIHETRQAIARIETGGYGVCVGCGGEIGQRRLEAMPTATRCIACA